MENTAGPNQRQLQESASLLKEKSNGKTDKTAKTFLDLPNELRIFKGRAVHLIDVAQISIANRMIRKRSRVISTVQNQARKDRRAQMFDFGWPHRRQDKDARKDAGI